MTHMDLASLSAAHEREPADEELLGRLHQALCRIFGHLPYVGVSLVKVTEEGMIGSYCPSHLRGCVVCVRCNQVMCEHRNLYEERPLGANRCWTRPGQGEYVEETEEDD